MNNTIKENWLDVQERIKKSNPDGKEITVIAVTKTHDIEVIEEALEIGFTEIGENKAQEFVEKYEQLYDQLQDQKPDIHWHMIGHLQRNKVKYVLGKTKLIHSLDSIRLAKEIEKRGKSEELSVDVLLQVNVAKEDSKYGIFIEDVKSFIENIKGYKYLNIRGLMTMAPYYDDPEKTRECFRKLKNLFDELKNEGYNNVSMEYLSMGMSNDFEVAIEEGSNMVRLGRTLFGERPKSQ